MFVVSKKKPNGHHTFGTPPAMHLTEEAAISEAERIAAENPDSEYWVFHAYPVLTLDR